MFGVFLRFVKWEIVNRFGWVVVVELVSENVFGGIG